MFLKVCSKFKPLSYILTRLQSDRKSIFFNDNLHKINKLFPIPKYGGSNFVTLITGDSDASKESTQYVKDILKKVNAPIIFEEITPRKAKECDDEDNSIHPMDELILSFERNRVALLTDFINLDIEEQNHRIRMGGSVKLYASVAKFFPFPGYQSKGINCDITLVGSNVMASHTGLEYEPIKGMVETLRICNAQSITEFLEYTYKYARENRHREIVFAHKYDYFELSDGLFLDIAKQINRKYTDIRINTMPINELALNLALDPRQFDLICCHERFTNMIASILAGICGGIDLFCLTSYGKHHALFQPLENRLSIPVDENPTEMSPYGVISACVQLLLYMGFCETGTAIWKALVKTMMKDEIKTKNYCGEYSAADVYCQVLSYLEYFKIYQR